MAEEFNYWMLEKSKEKLDQLSFKMSKHENYGMSYFTVWSNNMMSFTLGCDRGYFDCQITPNREPRKGFNLIPLLRYLKKDKEFYVKELEEANLSNTLKQEEYVDLFYEYYGIIESFCSTFNAETLNDYKAF